MKGPKPKFTYEYCLELAKKYETLSDLMKNDKLLYHAMHRHDWINGIVEAANLKRERTVHTFKSVKAIAMKYDSIYFWRTNDVNSYNWASRRKGFYQSIIAELDLRYNDLIIYSLSDCIEDAKKYNNISKWKTSGKTYYYAKKHNLIDEIVEYVGFKKFHSKKDWWYNL